MRESINKQWHTLGTEHCLQLLQVTDIGLSRAEALSRLAEFGPNLLAQRASLSLLRRFLLQFHNVLIYVLLASMLMTLALGEWLDAGVIGAVVLINAAIGFIQEGKAEQAMRAIQSMLTVQSRARRDGEVVSLAADKLVPGDVVLLEAGERVPADLRLLEARELRIDEAPLTGESLPVDKHTTLVALEASVGDRACMAYSGTLVTAGCGFGVVVATAGDTELGHISRLLGAVTTLQTPLLADMARLAKQLTLIIVGLAGLAFTFGVGLRGYSVNEMLMASVSLAVAAIPEGLPAVLTIILALGVQRMARRRAIIRRLPAVESLGAVTVICSDKTGTLTRNEMTVQQVFTAAHQYHVDGVGYAPHGSIYDENAQACDMDSADDLRELARAGLLANNASLSPSEPNWQISGDPTEAALLTLAGKLGLPTSVEKANLPLLDSLPFSSERGCLASLHHDHGGHGLIYLIGAPERLLAVCNRQWQAGCDEPMNLKYWHAILQQGASQGLRMLGLALRTLPQVQHELSYADIEGDFVLLGLVGMLDPPREEAIRAIAACHAAGIQVKMITGDHACTAASIAKSLGLGDAPPLTGIELDNLSDAALDARLPTTQVFARTSPSHKLRLVERLQALGERVAMTGDGVNDAPALKRADIGIAMGIKGTEVAKEAAQMVLADDNFASITDAVEEGRAVYDTLQKTILFILPTNGGEALVLLVAIIFGLTLPITPLQILWVNMITAVTLAMALAFEPAEEGLMRRPPRNPRLPLLNAVLLWRTVWIALLMTAASLGLFIYSQYLGWSLDASRTLAVNAMVACEIGYLFNNRSLYGPAHFGWRTNPMIWSMVVLLIGLQLALTYWSALQGLFATTDLPLRAWVWCLLVAIGVCTLIELEKSLMRRRQKAADSRNTGQ
jgi:magnesium-transporting ATPase (P-type)